MNSFIGIDNGSTGTIGVITPFDNFFWKTPIKIEQNYTKKKDNISRIDVIKLEYLLQVFENPFALVERPLTGSKYAKSVNRALRALEATICTLEALEIGYDYIDSKEWQKELLPSGLKDNTQLKKASRDIGTRMFPKHKELIVKHGDADGLLIAEYARRKFNVTPTSVNDTL